MLCIICIFIRYTLVSMLYVGYAARYPLDMVQHCPCFRSYISYIILSSSFMVYGLHIAYASMYIFRVSFKSISKILELFIFLEGELFILIFYVVPYISWNTAYLSTWMQVGINLLSLISFVVHFPWAISVATLDIYVCGSFHSFLKQYCYSRYLCLVSNVCLDSGLFKSSSPST